MTINTDLFSRPNEVQRTLFGIIDGYIEQGMGFEVVVEELEFVLEDEPAPVVDVCMCYLKWRGLEKGKEKVKNVTESGYGVYVGTNRRSADVDVPGVVPSIVLEEGKYVHVDLTVPEEHDELEVLVQASLSKCGETREYEVDEAEFLIFGEGNRYHLRTFRLQDFAPECVPVNGDDYGDLILTLSIAGKKELTLTIPVLGSLPGEDRKEESEEGRALSERVAALEAYPGRAAFRARVGELERHCRIAEARAQEGLKPNPPVMHTALIGNVGTGKGECAEILAALFHHYNYLNNENVHVVRVSKLTATIRSEAYSNMQSAIEEAQGGTLLLYGAHELAKVDGHIGEGNQGIVSALIDALVDRKQYPRWLLVLAGEPDGMDALLASTPELREHLAVPVYLKDLTPGELAQVADTCAAEHGLTLMKEARLKLESYLQHVYNHRGPGFDNGRMVRRLFDERIIPSMYSRLADAKKPTAKALRIVKPEDIPAVTTAPDTGLQELDALVGLGKIKARVKDYLFAVRLAGRRMALGLPTGMPRLHMAFLGNPGTGKTTVAEIIGKVFASWGILSGGRVIRTEKSQMVGQYIGETELKMTRLLARARGNILFIDEAYQLVEGGDKDYGRIVMNSLLTELGKENPDMVVILAGYTAPMKRLLESNEGIESRFPNVFNFEDYTTDELVEIGKQMIGRQGFILTPGAEANMRAIIEEEQDRPSPRFGNGRFVSNLIQNDILASLGARTAALEKPTQKDLCTILPEDVIVGKARKEAVFDDAAIDAALERLDALAGIRGVKEAIHNFVQSARYLHSIGEPYVGKGLLAWRFIGRSGTGKSTVAEIMASILKGMRLISNSHITQVKGERIFNVSESDCDYVLREAVKKSCNGLIFIDADDPKFGDDRFNYGRSVEQIRLKVKELTVEVGGECALVLAELDAPNSTVAEQLSEVGIYEFDHTLIFKDFTADELFDVLCHCLQKFDVTITPPAEKHLRAYLAAFQGTDEGNARTMKLMARTIYQQVILRESGLVRPPRTHQVQLADIANFRWVKKRGKIGF